MGWERYFFQFPNFFFLISTEYIHVSYLILLEIFFLYQSPILFSVWFAKQRSPLPRNAEIPALEDKKKNKKKTNKIKQNELINEYQGFNFTHFFFFESRGVQERGIWFNN